MYEFQTECNIILNLNQGITFNNPAVNLQIHDLYIYDYHFLWSTRHHSQLFEWHKHILLNKVQLVCAMRAEVSLVIGIHPSVYSTLSYGGCTI